MRQRSNPKSKRLPIEIDTTSNGGFAPQPLDNVSRRAEYPEQPGPHSLTDEPKARHECPNNLAAHGGSSV